jgi:hypothetical protein
VFLYIDLIAISSWFWLSRHQICHERLESNYFIDGGSGVTRCHAMEFVTRISTKLKSLSRYQIYQGIYFSLFHISSIVTILNILNFILVSAVISILDVTDLQRIRLYVAVFVTNAMDLALFQLEALACVSTRYCWLGLARM